ncbi:MAG: hypothetical protein H5T43_01950 [Methanomethylovorans sp.]|jgi:hypothetical protein|nr:hypothetical protein [Methanomethylovorans sp.]
MIHELLEFNGVNTANIHSMLSLCYDNLYINVSINERTWKFIITAAAIFGTNVRTLTENYSLMDFASKFKQGK